MPVVLTKALGRRDPLLPQWNLEIPPEWFTGDDDPLTLRKLISRIVAIEVERYNKEQKKQRYITVLSDDEIRQAAKRGVVRMGGREHELTPVEQEEAIGTALVGFQDGMYLVLIDEQEQRDLDKQIFITEESTITFIRLTFLSGR
jgi:hypothetical protein